MTLLPPLVPLRCKRDDCGLPQGGRCARANELVDPLALCPELYRSEAPQEPTPAPPRQPSVPPPPVREEPAQEEKEEPEEPGEPAPWRGRALGTEEAHRLLYRTPAPLLAVLGATDAGKTSLLAAFFLQIANGQRPGFPYRFASSRSLGEFHQLVEHARRYRAREGERAVDRTPVEESPDIGRLLHLGFRPEDARDNRHIDVLFTDVPGEWLRDWAKFDDDGLDRRLPLLRRARGFVVVVDASKLIMPGNEVDALTAQMIRRVADLVPEGAHPGLSLVINKMDRVIGEVPPPEGARAQERGAWGALGKRMRATWPAVEHARQQGLVVRLFPTSAFPGALDQGQPVNVVEPFGHALQHADVRERFSISLPAVPNGARPFQAMRRLGREDVSAPAGARSAEEGVAG